MLFTCWWCVCMWGKDGRSFTCCKSFNTEANKWNFEAEMNDARALFKVVSFRNVLWAIGGEGKNDILQSTKYYDDVSDKWTRSTHMIEKRIGHSAVVLRENIYNIRGRNWDEECLTTAEVFDIKTEQFT